MKLSLHGVAHAWLVGVCVVGLSLSACSAADESSRLGDETTGAGNAEPTFESTFCGSSICVDSGFISDPDGFSFANWKEPGSLDSASVIDMFGEAAVCVGDAVSECDLSPAAAQWLQQVNSAMVAGHCEGMAVLAQKIFQDATPLTRFDENAPFTFALGRSRNVDNSIEKLWASQLLPSLQSEALKFRQMSPGQIAEWLETSLRSGTSYSMGLYASAGVGHTVTPTAIRQGEDGWEVSLYDNDVPGVQQVLEISADGATWEYRPRDSSGIRLGERLFGGLGSMDLAAISARIFPQTPPFAPVVSSSATADPARPANVLFTSPGDQESTVFTAIVGGEIWKSQELMFDPSAPIAYTPLRTDGRAGAGFSAQWDSTTLGDVDLRMSFNSPQAGQAQMRSMSWDVPGYPRVATQINPNSSVNVNVKAAQDGLLTVTSEPTAVDQLVIINNQVSIALIVQDGVQVSLAGMDANGDVAVVLEELDAGGQTTEFVLPGSLSEEKVGEFVVDASNLQVGISATTVDSGTNSAALKDFLSRSGLEEDSIDEELPVDRPTPNSKDPQDSIAPQREPKPSAKPAPESTSDEGAPLVGDEVPELPSPDDIPEEPQDPGPPPEDQEADPGDNFPS